MKLELSKNDYYTQLAKEQGYPARSVYKLKEMDEKFHLFCKRDNVLDLGCFPGSWLIYLSREVGQNGKVVGVDVEELKINLPTNALFFQKNVFDDDFFNVIGTEKFSAVVSDLAPQTTGIKEKDIALSLEVAEKALEIAEHSLVEGGIFVCKFFEGQGSGEFFKNTSNKFGYCKLYRPSAVRKGSCEVYIVAKNFLPISSLPVN